MNRLFIPALLVISAIAGCGGEAPNARFVSGEQTLELIPEARKGFPTDAGQIKGVRQWVDELFGTPHDLVAWQRLPVNFGGVEGSVVSVDAPDALAGFTITLSEPVESSDSLNVTWLSGKNGGTTISGTRFDASTMKVTGVEELPTEGDSFILNAGTVLQEGRMLYMEHCVHCHGTSGDGNGPTAKYLNPRPRDYRLGRFKFKSTYDPAKPSRDDLDRIIRHGIPGTYMPSFMLLTDDESTAIVEYVRWLAMRGELEQRMVNELSSDYSTKAVKEILADGTTKREEILADLKTTLSEWPGAGEDDPGFVSETADELAESWTSAENSEETGINPTQPRAEDTDESRKIGRDLYLKKAKCVNCHGNAAKGNGPQTRDYEKNEAEGELFAEPGLHDLWDHVIPPRDLTSGIYRGGRRPIDIYRRIRGGITVSKMPPHKENLLTDEEVWHIVNYVLSIPLEGK